MIAECLDELFQSEAITLERVAESLPGLLDLKKAPTAHARAAVLSWLSRCVSTKPTAVSGPMRTQLGDLAKVALDDSDPKMREAGDELMTELCRLASKVGCRNHLSTPLNTTRHDKMSSPQNSAAIPYPHAVPPTPPTSTPRRPHRPRSAAPCR